MEGSRCSFCGKSGDEVDRLVTGPGVFICNECVSLCDDILAEAAPAAGATMEDVRRAVARIAPSDISVLFRGARGAGKSYLAKTLHRLSERPGQFVTVNCAALETETDLLRALDAADRGTLYLKDLDRLPPPVQSKLAVRIAPPRIDVRFISATRKDLAAMCVVGAFSPALFHPLSVLTVEVPGLQTRPDEIPALVNDLLVDLGTEAGLQALPRITPEAMERLRAHPWPGNVGQLASVLRRALLLSRGREITNQHLTLEMRAPFVPSPHDRRGAAEPTSHSSSLRRALEEAQRRMIVEALARRPSRERKPDHPEPVRSKLAAVRESSCSLCGQSYADAEMLLRGSAASICDQCVGEAQAAISVASGRPEATAGTNARCAFCGRQESEVGHLVGTDDALICDLCLDICDLYLGEQAATNWPKGQTIALRTSYSPARIANATDRARRDLLHGGPCRIVVLVDDGKTEEARALLDRMKGAIADLADFWEPTPSRRGDGLTAIALPRPGTQ